MMGKPGRKLTRALLRVRRVPMLSILAATGSVLAGGAVYTGLTLQAGFGPLAAGTVAAAAVLLMLVIQALYQQQRRMICQIGRLKQAGDQIGRLDELTARLATMEQALASVETLSQDVRQLGRHVTELRRTAAGLDNKLVSIGPYAGQDGPAANAPAGSDGKTGQDVIPLYHQDNNPDQEPTSRGAARQRQSAARRYARQQAAAQPLKGGVVSQSAEFRQLVRNIKHMTSSTRCHESEASRWAYLADIEEALGANRYDLQLQLMQDLETGQQYGFRATAELRDQAHNPLYFEACRDVVTESGMIAAIDDVMMLAISHAIHQMAQVGQVYPVFYALSPDALLDPEFMAEFSAFLEAEPELAHHLVLELPARCLDWAKHSAYKAPLEALMALGIRYCVLDLSPKLARRWNHKAKGISFVEYEFGKLINGYYSQDNRPETVSELAAELKRAGPRLVISGLDDQLSLSGLGERSNILARGDYFGDPMLANLHFSDQDMSVDGDG